MTKIHQWHIWLTISINKNKHCGVVSFQGLLPFQENKQDINTGNHRRNKIVILVYVIENEN